MSSVTWNGFSECMKQANLCDSSLLGRDLDNIFIGAFYLIFFGRFFCTRVIFASGGFHVMPNESLPSFVTPAANVKGSGVAELVDDTGSATQGNDHTLVRFEFLEALVRVAIVKFIKCMIFHPLYYILSLPIRPIILIRFCCY